jgi:hypothetical protein
MSSCTCARALQVVLIAFAALGTPNLAAIAVTARLLDILRNLHAEPCTDEMGRLFSMLANATLAWGIGAGVLVGVVLMMTGVQQSYALAADPVERYVRFLLMLSAFTQILNVIFVGLGLLTLSDGSCMFLSADCAARLAGLHDPLPNRPLASPRPAQQRGTPRSPVVGTAVSDAVQVWDSLANERRAVVLGGSGRAGQVPERANQMRAMARERRDAPPRRASLEELMARPNLLPQLLDPGQRDRLVEALQALEERWLERPEARFQERFQRATDRAAERALGAV